MPTLRKSIANSQNSSKLPPPLPQPNEAAATTISEVYVVASTGEFSTSYEEHLDRLILYHQPVWSCRLTGHTGLTYFEALKSEQAARKLLEIFPEWWKPFILNSVHCATDSIEALATRISNHCRSHLALNEPIRLAFNGNMYEGIVSATPPAEQESLLGNNNTASYRISINDGDMIITGACRGPEDVQRLYLPPSKLLIKKFIRASALRYGHTGMPWLVHNDLITRFSITKQLPPELAERVYHLQSLRQQRAAKASNAQGGLVIPSSSNLTSSQPSLPEKLKFPILDEFIPPDLQTDSTLWPIPKEFNPRMSIVTDGAMTMVLEFWQFIHAFGPNLEISPMSLHVLMSALEYEEEQNPVLEAICKVFMKQFNRVIRSSKLLEERISRYLGNGSVSDLPPFIYTEPSPPQMVPGNNNNDVDDCNHNHDDDNSNHDNNGDIQNADGDDEKIEEFIAQLRLAKKVDWSMDVVNFLWDIKTIPEIKLILMKMYSTRKRIYELPGSIKIRLLTGLRNFYLAGISLRPIVDKEVDAIAEARHKIRESEGERRRIVKEGQELLAEQDSLSRKLEDESLDLKTVKELKRALRSIDAKLSKSVKAEERANHEISIATNKQYEHSVVRMRELGEDRFKRRYWWLDLHLVKPIHRHYSTGILLVESEGKAVVKKAPDGDDHNNKSANLVVINSHWAYYDEPEKLDALLTFLNPLGCREAHLGAAITQFKELISKSLTRFPHMDSTPLSGVEPATIESEEDMPVVLLRRRTLKRRLPEEVAEFLRYQNTFKAVKKS